MRKAQSESTINVNNALYKKRIDLIIDYISQILVYGSDTKGTISIDKNHFDDGEYLILTVSVLKNSYFRWHDLGILVKDNLPFYQLIYDCILNKFEKFNIDFCNHSIIHISSSVNHNQIDMNFTLTTKKEKEWFQNQERIFYNKNK